MHKAALRDDVWPSVMKESEVLGSLSTLPNCRGYHVAFVQAGRLFTRICMVDDASNSTQLLVSLEVKRAS